MSNLQPHRGSVGWPLAIMVCSLATASCADAYIPGARKIIPGSVFETIVFRHPTVLPTRQPDGKR